MKRLISLILVIIFACTLFVGCEKGEDTSSGADGSTAAKNESIKVEEGKTYYGVIDIKNYGKITVKLDPSQAPITVQNFIDLAQSGFYDGLTFHRIMSGFMIQGGDPNGNGTGGSGKNIKGEFTSNGHNNTLAHKRGVISMARSSKPDSASSQFFIMHQDASHLDGKYAAFGYVTEGIEVVDAICKAAKPVDNNGTILAANQPVITSVRIIVEG